MFIFPANEEVIAPHVPVPRAIAFDLDGTLIDSHVTIARACNVALATVGRKPLSEPIIAGFVGDGARLLLARALGETPEDGRTPDAKLIERTYEAWLSAYVADPILGTSWMPGAQDLLSICAAANVPIAVVTNKARPATDAIFAAFGASLTSRFAAIVGGGECALKPSPEPIHLAASRLGVAVSDLWMVGDGVQDVRAARAAGAYSIAVRGGFSTDEALIAAEPHVIVDSLADVGRLVTSLTSDRPV